MHHTIKTLLIANRSEVAARIQTTAQQQGIKTVCVYTRDDTAQAHLAYADAVYQLSGSGSQAYLNQDDIIAIAKASGADAIHPGYGFLSEVAHFAERVTQEGLIFIGPKADTIALLGDKGQARALALKCNIPIVPGTTFAHTDHADAAAYAQTIGYPVLLKAVGGGGGRGMAPISEPDDFAVTWHRIAQEGLRNYHSTDIVVEKYVTNPRHIEVQVASDGANGLHFFERDCSVQRRRQKIVEQAPAPHLSDATRHKLHADAVALITAVPYHGIATVEFIVTADETYYFLEVNTRLQVEHGVTEMITGIDLVALQLHIAQYHTLPYQQPSIHQRGHALQCRIYAEDPGAEFTPSTGTIHAHHIPAHLNGRIEHSIGVPYKITGLYDPMLSKIITYAPTAAQARTSMLQFLRHYRLAGIVTNIAFLRHICAHQLFCNGTVHTQSMPELLASFTPRSTPDLALLAAALSNHTSTQHTPEEGCRKLPTGTWKEQRWK